VILLTGKLRILLVLLICVSAGGAEEKDAGISNETLQLRIPGSKYSSIREVDFRNTPVLQIDSAFGNGSTWPALKDGRFRRDAKVAKKKSHSGDEIALEAVGYLPAKSGREYALVRLIYTTWFGSSSSEGQVLIIDLDPDGYPVIRQKIEYNIRGADPDEAWAHFNPADNRLRVSAVHGWEHCCNKGRIIITFDWNGEKFVPVGRKVLPLRHPQ
jgi:hypothetical protein